MPPPWDSPQFEALDSSTVSSLTLVASIAILPNDSIPPPPVKHALGPVAIAWLSFTTLLRSVRSVQLKIPPPDAPLARLPPVRLSVTVVLVSANVPRLSMQIGRAHV